MFVVVRVSLYVAARSLAVVGRQTRILLIRTTMAKYHLSYIQSYPEQYLLCIQPYPAVVGRQTRILLIRTTEEGTCGGDGGGGGSGGGGGGSGDLSGNKRRGGQVGWKLLTTAL